MSAAVKRAFTIRPDYLVSDFLRHVAENGKPHTWPYHSHEEPSRDGVVVLKMNFSIPKHFIALNGRAPCPICSPESPKYETGHLLWSETTGKLHAVGHCCGHNYFAEGVYAEGLIEARRRENRLFDEQVIEVNWHLPGLFLEVATSIRTQVRAYDSIVKFLRRHLSNELVRAIYRNAADGDGILTVLEYVRVADSAEGSLKAVEKPISGRALEGFSILRGGKRSVSAEGRLHQATVAFEQLGWNTQDDAIAWLATQPDGDLAQLSRWLRETTETFGTIRSDLLAANRFLRSENLALLNEWLQAVGQNRTKLVRQGDHITIWRSGAHRAVIPPVLNQPIFETLSLEG